MSPCRKPPSQTIMRWTRRAATPTLEPMHRQRRARAWRCAVLAAAVWLAWPLSPALAAERLSREMHDQPGMPTGIKSIIQDADGYLWIASAQGLDRFDGLEVRPWGRDKVNSRLEWLAAGPRGQVAAAHETLPAWEVDGESLRAVTGPDGQPIPTVRQIGYDAHGRLWLISAERLMARDETGAWMRDVPDSIPGERAVSLGSVPCSMEWSFRRVRGISTVSCRLRRRAASPPSRKAISPACTCWTRSHCWRPSASALTRVCTRSRVR